MVLRINRHICFYALVTVLLSLILVRYAFQVDIPRLVLTALVVLMAFLGDQNETLAVLMCCIPMHEAIDFYYSILLCAIIYVLKSLKNFSIDAVTIVVVFSMIVYELLHCFTDDFSFKLFIINVSTILVLFAVMGVGAQKIDYAFIVRIMSVAAVFMCLMLLVNMVVRANGDFAVAFFNMQRLGTLSDTDTLLGGAINPNAIGVINLLTAVGLMQISVKGQYKKTDIALIVFLLMFGLFTLSRTFIVCLALAVILWIIGQPGTAKKKIRALASVVLVGCLLLVLVFALFPDVVENFVRRFLADDITSGRDSLMIDYHEYILNNPKIMFFGIGLNDFVEKAINIYRISWNVPHMSIQEIVVAWGIPGLLLFAALILMMIIESKRYGIKKNLINYIPLIIILFKSIAGQLLTSGYSMLALSFAYLSLCQDFTPKAKDENIRL